MFPQRSISATRNTGHIWQSVSGSIKELQGGFRNNEKMGDINTSQKYQYDP